MPLTKLLKKHLYFYSICQFCSQIQTCPATSALHCEFQVLQIKSKLPQGFIELFPHLTCRTFNGKIPVEKTHVAVLPWGDGKDLASAAQCFVALLSGKFHTSVLVFQRDVLIYN